MMSSPYTLMLTDWQCRMILEYRDLTDREQKLADYVEHFEDDFPVMEGDITQEAHDLLQRQLECMREYKSVLLARIRYHLGSLGWSLVQKDKNGEFPPL